MTNATHTPGPWRTNRGGVEGPNREPICAGQFNATDGVTMENCNRNLQLIAAAPELLEALQKCEAIIGQLCETPDKAREIALQGYVGHARAVSRAALSKATH